LTALSILAPRAHDHSDLRQGSRALARTDFLSMRRVFVSYSQPDFRLTSGLGQSQSSKPELSIPAAGQKDRGSGDENAHSLADHFNHDRERINHASVWDEEYNQKTNSRMNDITERTRGAFIPNDRNDCNKH